MARPHAVHYGGRAVRERRGARCASRLQHADGARHTVVRHTVPDPLVQAAAIGHSGEAGTGEAGAPRPAAPPQTSKPQSFTGSVYVDSRPRGARVLLDGKVIGTTPMRISDIAVGSHIIKLQLDDHSDWTTSTRVVSGQETRVTGSLERIR